MNRLGHVQMLHLRPASSWRVPVLLAQASADVGIAAVVEAIAAHHATLAAAPDRGERARRRREGELLDSLGEELRRRLERVLGVSPDGLGPLLDAVRSGTVDPYSAAVRILQDARALERLLDGSQS